MGKGMQCLECWVIQVNQLCSCYGKLQERIIKKQLISYISEKQHFPVHSMTLFKAAPLLQTFSYVMYSLPTLSKEKQNKMSSPLILRRLLIKCCLINFCRHYHLCSCIEVCYAGLKFSPRQNSARVCGQ